jgi:hypothetical protein
MRHCFSLATRGKNKECKISPRLISEYIVKMARYDEMKYVAKENRRM